MIIYYHILFIIPFDPSVHKHYPRKIWEKKYYVPDDRGLIDIFEYVQKRKGWIYSSHAPEYPEWGIKVGFTKKDPFIRAKQIVNAGNHHIEILNAVFVMNAPWAEKAAHQYLAAYINAKEWFSCSKDIAMESLMHASNQEETIVGRYFNKDILISGDKDAFMQHGVILESLIDMF